MKIRPYCIEFLKNVSNYFDTYIFTASTYNYGSGIIKFLDPDSMYYLYMINRIRYIKGCYYRNNCMETKNGLFIKDLRIFSDLKPKDVILVDNLSHSFGLQLFNGIPILEWKYSDQTRQDRINLIKNCTISFST